MKAKLFSVGHLVVLAMASTGHSAAAEDAEPSQSAVGSGLLEEVVVTARKRAERLQDLPGSGAALTEGFLDDIGGVHDLREMLDQVVGVTIVEANSSDLSEPSIRGAGQSRNRMSVSATGIYRNGAYFASQSLGGRSFERFDTYDVERVEVLRGPQGALYGRNALGGAINMISKKPQPEIDYEFGALVGDNERMQYEGILNVPINETVATRFSVVKDDQDDGFYDDIEGDPVDTRDYLHGRASLRFQPSDSLDINYMFDHMDDERPIGIRVRRAGSVLDLTGGDPFQTTINSRHQVENEVQNHNLMVDYDLERGTLTSVTNYRDRNIERFQDQDHNGPSAAAATRNLLGYTDVDAEILFQDLRFASAASGPVTWLIGADYYTVDTFEYIDNFVRGGQTTPNSSIRSVDVEQDSWAVYGALEYAFREIPLTVSAEARYAYDEVQGEVLGFLPRQSPEPFTDIVDDNDFTNVPWTLTASWRFGDSPLGPLDESMVYGKVASSYRHGGLNLNEGLPTDRFPTKPVYDEETSLTYELGFKSGWFGGSMTFNGAAYFIDYEDFLDTTTNGCPELCTYFDPVTVEPLGFDANGEPIEFTLGGVEALPSPTAFFIDNVGEVEAWGVELELAWRTTIEATGGSLLTNLGWSRQLGEVVAISDAVAPSNADVDGARLNRLRERQIKGNVIYRQPLGASGWLEGAQFLVSATYVHEHGGVANLNADPFTLDGVDRLDARIGFDAPRWSITLNGSNLLDKDYELWRRTVQYTINDPRYYYAEVRFRMR